MDNKQLAEMIKALRKKKLEEQDPQSSSKAYLKKQQFKPVHIADPRAGNKETSPNDYVNRMAEAAVFKQQGVGGRHRPRVTVGNKSKLPSDRTYQTSGNQMRRPKTYGNTARSVAEEETEDLGNTDTKKKSQKVTLSPEIEQFGKQ